MTDPEIDALIIREHARLRGLIASFPSIEIQGDRYVQLDLILKQLQLSEADKPREERYRRISLS